MKLVTIMTLTHTICKRNVCPSLNCLLEHAGNGGLWGWVGRGVCVCENNDLIYVDRSMEPRLKQLISRLFQNDIYTKNM